MAAIHLAQQKIAADTAGQTHPAGAVLDVTSGTPSSATPAEVLPNLIHGANGHLGAILSGGTHPENPVTTPVSTQLVKATDSIRGRLGGLVPRPSGTVAPGPAGGHATATANAAEAVTHASGQVAEGVRQTSSRVRKFLGI